MELRQLKYFAALVAHGNFAKAATALHRSQPALTRSVQALEGYLGYSLLDRAYGHVTPTSAGEIVLAHAKRILQESSDIQRDLAMLYGLERGSLRAGLGPFASAALAQKVTSQMIQRYPGLAIEITVSDTQALTDLLSADTIDFFIAETRGLKNDGRFDVERLPSLGVGFFVRPAHPLLKNKKLSLSDLLNYPVASPRIPEAFAEYFQGLLPAHARPLFTVKYDDMHALRTLALETETVVMAPKKWGNTERENALVTLPLDLVEEFRTGYGIVTPVGRTPSPARLAFLSLVRGVLAGIKLV